MGRVGKFSYAEEAGFGDYAADTLPEHSSASR